MGQANTSWIPSTHRRHPMTSDLMKAADELASLLNDMIDPNKPLRPEWDEAGRTALTAYRTARESDLQRKWGAEKVG